MYQWFDKYPAHKFVSWTNLHPVLLQKNTTNLAELVSFCETATSLCIMTRIYLKSHLSGPTERILFSLKSSLRSLSLPTMEWTWPIISSTISLHYSMFTACSQWARLWLSQEATLLIPFLCTWEALLFKNELMMCKRIILYSHTIYGALQCMYCNYAQKPGLTSFGKSAQVKLWGYRC